MKFMKLMKDGGEQSRVWGFFFVEAKKAFSFVVLRFFDGSRDAYHSHAFNAVSWVIRGKLTEHEFNGSIRTYTRSIRPIITPRTMFHKVVSEGDTWVLSFRGPWVDKWKEYIPSTGTSLTLTHGRKIVSKT
jgi:hypothetical protein